MAKLSKVFNTKTALDVLYVGGGAVAGTVVGSTVYSKIKDKVDAEGKFAPYIKGGIPIVAGVLLPSLLGSSTAVKGAGQGMVAAGASIIVKDLLEKAGVEVATNGVGNVMMQGVGNVMMQGSDYMSPTRDLGNGASLGNTEGYDDYSATSYDFTSAEAGEMDY
jgi:hypothetical protein